MSAFEKYGSAIGTIKDFPQKGIVFRDVSPLLKNGKLREQAYDDLAKHYIEGKIKVDIVAGIESRGFIIGTALAARLNAGFVMIRKPSKLPGKIISVDYGLEYGKNTLCLQSDSIEAKQTVLIVDDLLATGGSAAAAIKLVQQLEGQIVGACFLIELDGLEGRKKLSSIPVFSLLNFPAAGDDIGDGKKEPKEEPKKEAKKSAAEIKKEEEEMEKDNRSVVVYYPTMKDVAVNVVNSFPSLYRLGSVQWNFFADGWPNIKFEHMKFLEGRNVVFIGSLYDRSKLIEQLSLIMVLPRQFVQSLDIILPYFAPATMERVDEEGVLATAETVAKLVTTSIPMTRTGPASLRIFDIHALPVRFYFPDTVMLRLLTAIPLLIEIISKDNYVVCFPDDGAAKRFKKDFAGFPIIVCAKVREGDSRIVKVTDEINFTPNTKMDHVIIVDDLVQSGGTLYECRKALLEHGAKKVSAFVTHPVFPNHGYKRFFDDGDRAGFENFYVTNTIPEVSSLVEGKKPFKVIKIDNLLANDIEKLTRHRK